MHRLRRWVLSPLAGERYVRDVPVAPDALSLRLIGAINNRPKRLLGILKVSAEWVGVVSANEFVVWEKQQHATRATGRIRGRRGGSRVEAHIALTRRTLLLGVAFYALFAVAVLGVLASETGLGMGPPGLAIALAGALLTLAVFWSAALRQRAALRSFLNGVFRERDPG